MDLLQNKGVAIDQQTFTWKDMVGSPISKLDDDAFTRVRVILLYALELDALRLSHVGARMNGELRSSLAEIRRIEQHQATTINCLLSADHSLLETTIAYEQAAVEVTASVAQRERDPYVAKVYRFGLIEDLDHLYRFAALLDRLEGKDANNILQGYTDIVPGRPGLDEHRAPVDNLRLPLALDADLSSQLHATLITALEHQSHIFYTTIGPMFADPAARQLYAEIASIEEQHVTQYASLVNPRQSFLEQWLLHEATEVYAYHSCARSENNPRIRAIWERFCDYELGHLHHVGELLRRLEKRDPAEILTRTVPPTLAFRSQRDFVREVLESEIDMRANGVNLVDRGRESAVSQEYRRQLNIEGSPSTHVASAYRWTSGTELNRSIRRAA